MTLCKLLVVDKEFTVLSDVQTVQSCWQERLNTRRGLPQGDARFLPLVKQILPDLQGTVSRCLAAKQTLKESPIVTLQLN